MLIGWRALGGEPNLETSRPNRKVKPWAKENLSIGWIPLEKIF